MNIQILLETLHLAEKLKNNTRHSWTSAGRHESVAEHSWRLALLASFIGDEFPEADMNRVIKMCLYHDIGEAFTGDIPSFLKTEKDEENENNWVAAWVNSLPEPHRAELKALFEEMDALVTAEARIYKALDKLEAVIQHNEADISTWLENEYTLNLTYGIENAEFSPYLKQLRQTVKEETKKKIEANIAH